MGSKFGFNGVATTGGKKKPRPNRGKGKRRMRIRRVSVPCVRHGWKLISASCVAPHAAIICLVRIIIELAYRSGGPIAVRQRLERPERLQANQRRSNPWHSK